jgi:hypothetical protein
MDNEHAKEIMKAYRDRLTSSCSNQLDSDIEAFNIAIDSIRPQGKWLPDCDSFTCSNCGASALEIGTRCVKTKYCHECGAVMDKGATVC